MKKEKKTIIQVYQITMFDVINKKHHLTIHAKHGIKIQQSLCQRQTESRIKYGAPSHML